MLSILPVNSFSRSADLVGDFFLVEGDDLLDGAHTFLEVFAHARSS